MRIDRRLLGWGTFFIVVGAIPVAVRGGYLDAAVVEGWARLWPLLLIGWGLGLLLRRTPVDWLGGAVTTLTLGVMGGGLIATGWSGLPMTAGCGDDSGAPFAVQRGTLTSNGALSVELPCGRLTLDAVDGTDWAVQGSSEDGTAPGVETDGNVVRISGPEGFDVGFIGARTTWAVNLPRDPENVGLDVTVNAGEGSLALTGARLSSLNLTLNAGELTADAGGAVTLERINGTINAGSGFVSLPALSVDVNFTVNAGSLELCVPADVGVRVESSSTLASNNLDSLGLEKVGEEAWQTSGYGSSATRIDVNVTANAGSFELTIGGGCGA